MFEFKKLRMAEPEIAIQREIFSLKYCYFPFHFIKIYAIGPRESQKCFLLYV